MSEQTDKHSEKLVVKAPAGGGGAGEGGEDDVMRRQAYLRRKKGAVETKYPSGGKRSHHKLPSHEKRRLGVGPADLRLRIAEYTDKVWNDATYTYAAHDSIPLYGLLFGFTALTALVAVHRTANALEAACHRLVRTPVALLRALQWRAANPDATLHLDNTTNAAMATAGALVDAISAHRDFDINQCHFPLDAATPMPAVAQVKRFSAAAREEIFGSPPRVQSVNNVCRNEYSLTQAAYDPVSDFMAQSRAAKVKDRETEKLMARKWRARQEEVRQRADGKATGKATDDNDDGDIVDVTGLFGAPANNEPAPAGVRSRSPSPPTGSATSPTSPSLKDPRAPWHEEVCGRFDDDEDDASDDSEVKGMTAEQKSAERHFRRAMKRVDDFEEKMENAYLLELQNPESPGPQEDEPAVDRTAYALVSDLPVRRFAITPEDNNWARFMRKCYADASPPSLMSLPPRPFVETKSADEQADTKSYPVPPFTYMTLCVACGKPASSYCSLCGCAVHTFSDPHRIIGPATGCKLPCGDRDARVNVLKCAVCTGICVPSPLATAEWLNSVQLIGYEPDVLADVLMRVWAMITRTCAALRADEDIDFALRPESHRFLADMGRMRESLMNALAASIGGDNSSSTGGGGGGGGDGGGV